MCIVKGGNCDIYLDKENNIAIKKLRNTSSQERINRFRQELEIVKELSTDKSLRICEIKNINIDEKITDCYYEIAILSTYFGRRYINEKWICIYSINEKQKFKYGLANSKKYMRIQLIYSKRNLEFINSVIKSK